MDQSKLPQLNTRQPECLKSTLNGHYSLKVTNVIDISKPTQDLTSAFLQIDDEDDNEEDQDIDKSSESYNVKKLKGKYAAKGATKKEISRKGPRMLQLDLRDRDGTNIRAIEVNPIDKLTNIKMDSNIQLTGPLTIRCGTILLEESNVICIRENVS